MKNNQDRESVHGKRVKLSGLIRQTFKDGAKVAK